LNFTVDQNSNDATAHLAELGYVDHQEVSLREATLRSQLDAELQQALAAHKQGRFDEAIGILERLKADDPSWIAPHQALAEVHFQAGRWREVQDELTWLEHHAIETPRLSLMAAAIAVNRRDFRAALELLDYASFVDPQLAGIQTLHGNVLLRLGRVDDAATAFEKALTQNESDVRALDGMTSLRLRQGDFEQAADWALSALDSDMRFARAHYHLGIALWQMRRLPEAIIALETCARLDANTIAPFRRLEQLATEARDAKQAAEYRAQARERIRTRRAHRNLAAGPSLA
jgi:tetratricopeptide (TPR) repeat protein